MFVYESVWRSPFHDDIDAAADDYDDDNYKSRAKENPVNCKGCNHVIRKYKTENKLMRKVFYFVFEISRLIFLFFRSYIVHSSKEQEKKNGFFMAEVTK